ncbi:hypothetical protein B0H17DRAFT_1180111 [Mycena rosella]|uniref:DUF6534 domain-containing protein n=1 Tax=Mycena rosella TaxID=1033263 RepID=A0AAD7DEM1_MYCRO|nr:hypothetical protein B0H17DRAFT_1180111 [Mycena rosella]
MSSEVEKLTLPVFMGTLLNWALFGVLVVQVWIYYTAFPRDRTLTKILVAVVLLIEILGTLGNTRDTIRIFGAGWGDIAVLDDVGWAWFSVPIIGSISAAIGQSFFAWRIYIIGNGNLYIPVAIIAITLCQLGAGIWTGVEICLAERFSELQFTNVTATALWLASTSACDLIIVSSTVFYLRRASKPEFKKTKAVLSRIIMVTVETGLLCALFAIFDLYLFATYKGANYHLALCIELSKIYSNSILLIFNSRAHIGHTPPNETTRYTSSDGPFRSGTRIPIQVQVELNRITSDSTLHTDSGGYEGKLEV